MKLTDSDWCEVMSALESKALRLEQGAYDDGEVDAAEWARHLRDIQKRLGCQLAEKGILV